MTKGIERLTDDAHAFLAEYHLATLTTLRQDGRPHVVPVGFTYADGIVRVITSGTSQKALNVARAGHATVCQVDRARWLTLGGPARVLDDPESVADAEARYAERYRPPRVNPQRVVLEVTVTDVMGQAGLLHPRR
ncbi:PPOX class F420-dependent oxidoreductase [Aeromicrobium massiliense]|uniref:PPOX class F420-dependent oxidoreductase n=1 Tax=Aeromicrobium massiliense TaxID=1464554 RepID=UPI000302C727|nr:PPOX class F420-dependent oxidoreductase [Aeromicrobium massiliense]